eukprot:5154157-Amphidinium_carterae.1
MMSLLMQELNSHSQICNMQFRFCGLIVPVCDLSERGPGLQLADITFYPKPLSIEAIEDVLAFGLPRASITRGVGD